MPPQLHLSREEVLAGVRAYHMDMSRRAGRAVAASAHACAWFHFSTGAGVAFRTLACLVAQVFLWLGAVGQVLVIGLFVVFCWYAGTTVLWVVRESGLKDLLLPPRAAGAGT